MQGTKKILAVSFMDRQMREMEPEGERVLGTFQFFSSLVKYTGCCFVMLCGLHVN